MHPQPKSFQIVLTIHKDATERLELINPILAAETRKILNINKSERHIRGGMATKQKYRVSVTPIKGAEGETFKISI